MAQGNDRFVFLLRVLTFACGVALIALGIVKFISMSIGGPRDFFLTVYYILFGILVCFSEMPCDRLMSCFFFLKYYIGKALFFLFLGTITFRWTPVYFLVISIVMFCASGFYFVLFFTCSQERVSQPKDNNHEDSKFEKRNVENEA
ncbi:hypothetical protein SteCoe_12085 [Stentor coeruleus]|uniref:COPI associated protein n=1 Tax=Stentor coeruleus TaxID=5963 RepID=A0A1R2CBR4_9CILI|nr:hypothetical protein SteCoe_12085 [Stentor coeruleus]